MNQLNKSTPDIADENESEVNAIEVQFRHFGKVAAFFGQAVTVKCFEDNSLVKELANSAGEGRVMVVEGGASMRRALLGDMIAEAAIDNGWSGFVINGCIRDAEIIDQLPIGVKALGTIPIKTEKRGEGQTQVAVSFGNVNIAPGDYIYADQNGVLVSKLSLVT